MVALTYGDTRVATPESKIATKVASKTPVATVPRQSFFARLLKAMAESRMRQAEREIRLYAPRLILPAQYDAEGNLRMDTNTPRGGW